MIEVSVLQQLIDRAVWYRTGCDSLEDREGYFASGECARDAAHDLEVAIGEIRALITEVVALTPPQAKSHLLTGLLAHLPKEGTPWSMEQRAYWLKLAVLVFEVVYTRAPEDRQCINVAFFPEHDAVRA